MDYSTLSFPVLHYLPEFAEIHVHCFGDTIQPSHPLSPLVWAPESRSHPLGQVSLSPVALMAHQVALPWGDFLLGPILAATLRHLTTT